MENDRVAGSMSTLGKLARRVKSAIGWPARSRETPIPPDFSPDVVATVNAVRSHTMTSVERLFALIQAVEYVVDANIPGDVVECGVWKGGSMMAAALTLVRLGCTDRTLHLFDTFEGMPPASAADKDFSGDSATRLLAEEDPEVSLIWARANIDEVRRNMATTGYPAELVKFVRGRVEDTIPQNAPEQVSLLRIDTDWYESTKHEMEHLFPRLSPGGVLIIDDYGHWQGARKAVDEYLKNANVRLLLCRIDYTGRIAVKPS